MATYEVLIVGGSSTPGSVDQPIIDAIADFSDGNTWNTTYRDQSGSKDPTGYDVVVFPTSGVFNGNWSGTGDWIKQNVPMIVPGNRVSSGGESMSSSGSRTGSNTQADVTTAGAAHAIGVEMGWADNDTVDVWTAGGQSFTPASDFVAAAEILLEVVGDDTKVIMAVIESGDAGVSLNSPSRRMALNRPDYMEADGTNDENELLRVSLLWLMDELGGAATQDISPTAIASGSSTTQPSLSAGAVDASITPIASGSATTEPSLSVGAVDISPTPIASGSSTTQPSLAPGSVDISPTPIGSGSATTEPSVSAPAIPTQDISPTPIGSGSSVTPAVVAVGAGVQIIAPTPIGSGSALSAPVLAPGAVDIAPSPIGSGSSLSAPSLAGQLIAAPVPIPSGSVLTEPTLTLGAGQGTATMSFDVDVVDSYGRVKTGRAIGSLSAHILDTKRPAQPLPER